MKLTHIIPLVVLSLSIFASCTKETDSDDSKPVIEIERPIDGDTLFINDTVHLEMTLTDNRELASCLVDIHNDFDSHHHAKSTAHGEEPWVLSRSLDVAGLKTFRVHDHEIVVPATVNGNDIAQGNYHCIITCTDKAGNQTQIVVNMVLSAGSHSGH